VTFDLTGSSQVVNVSPKWIEIMHYSPDGRFLAIGSHDCTIYIYEGTRCFSKLKKHSGAITALDWSADSSYIRSNCTGYELLFWKIDENGIGKQDPDGRSNTTGTLWATGHTKFGWHVDAIVPKGCDYTHVNGVDCDVDRNYVVTGDDFGLVNVFRNPCRAGSMPFSLRGHSEHVVRVAFADGDKYIFSVGGQDETLMQWRKC